VNLAIETIHLTKRYPPRSGWRSLLRPAAEPGVLAVDDVSLAVAPGEIFGLLGPNGAGKSTLVRLLCTLVLPNAGQARICGHDLADEVAVKSCVGLAGGEERSFYWRLSGRENLHFYGTLQGLSPSYVTRRISELERTLDLSAALTGRFDRLSTGMRRRLDVARALLHSPAVLFLDEPTRSLDPNAVACLHEQIRTIAGAGHTVFLVTHQLDEAEALCDRIAIMHQGRLRAVATVGELRRALFPQRRYVLTVVPPADLPSPPWTSWPWPVEELPAPAPQCRVAVELPAQLAIDVLLNLLFIAGVRIVDIHAEETPLDRIFQRVTDADPLPLAPSPPAARTLSSPAAGDPASHIPPFPAALRKAWAFIRRDVQTQLSYRLSSLLQVLGILFSVAAFFFVARVFGTAASPYLAEYDGNYFAFVLVGIAFAAYQSVGLYAFSEAIRSGQTQGTLEAMLVTPTRLETILGASALWSFVLASFQVLGYLLVGALLFGAPLGQANVGTALLVLFVAILAFSGLGILSASVILVTKRGDPVNLLFASLSSLLSGVYYPVAVLPAWLQALSNLLPLTHALQAMRLALLEGAGVVQVAPNLVMLGLFAAIVLPGGIVAFRWALRKARAEGSLTQY
jgi:ABC-2 type transport system permease protein